MPILWPEIPAYLMVLPLMDIVGRKPLFSGPPSSPHVAPGSLLFTGVACITCGFLEEVAPCPATLPGGFPHRARHDRKVLRLEQLRGGLHVSSQPHHHLPQVHRRALPHPHPQHWGGHLLSHGQVGGQRHSSTAQDWRGNPRTLHRPLPP